MEQSAGRSITPEPAMNKAYTLISALVIALVAVFHLVRALMGWDFIIGDYSLAVMRSWIVFGVLFCLAAWGIKGGSAYLIVSSLLFGLVAILHIYRVLVTGTVVLVNNAEFPLNASWGAFALCLLLCAWGIKSYVSRNN